MKDRTAKRVSKLKRAIAYYEAQLDQEVRLFRKYAEEYDAENIVSFLPYHIFLIKDTQNQLQKLRHQLQLLQVLENSGDVTKKQKY